jgi:hypothetical protein
VWGLRVPAVRGAPGAGGAVNEHDHEHGLRLMGLWPGPFDGVAAARSRAAAVAELTNVQALARASKRILYHRHHPDRAGKGADVDALAAVVAAAAWVAGRKLDDVWPPRSQARQRVTRRGPVEVEASATGIRITYRGRR